MIIRKIILVLFLFIGIYALIQSIHNIYRIKQSQNWIQTEAVVTYTQIQQIEKKRGDKFCPVINYSFDLNGTKYDGNKLTLQSGEWYNTKAEANNALAGYLHKDDRSKVTIYYNPDDPNDSAIVRGETDNEYLIMFYGIAFLVIGLLINRKWLISLYKKVRN